MKLALVDYGGGNVGSVAIAFERLGLQPLLTADLAEIASADRVIIPGVGAAGEAMDELRGRGLVEPLCALKQPVLGICLGMQLLFERSDENETECLGIIPGAVRKLVPASDRPVPHMGWSSLSVSDPAIGLEQGDYVYFAHGFACDDGPYSVATADYGQAIPAVVRKDNFSGAQFHPEKSGPAGARFLEAFLK